MRLYVIACEVLFRELCHLAALSPHLVDFKWVSQGLHDLGAEKMRPRLQEEIDAVPDGYDAVALAYGLCNNGALALRAAKTRLAIPRAHDCISLFLGSRQRYREYFDSHPGTYFLTRGWIERDDDNLENVGPGVCEMLGLKLSFEQMVEKYGREEAEYLAAELGDLVKNYSRLCYVRAPFEADNLGADEAKRRADKKGWEYEELPGGLELLQKLLWGEWDTDFLVLEPGAESRPSYDDNVFA